MLMRENFVYLQPMTANKQTRLSDLIALVSNIYTYEGYVPSSETLAKIKLADIINYLKISHQYYIEVSMKDLDETIHAVLEPCDEKRRTVILSFFKSYQEEMFRHFAFEEEHVFPYAEALLTGAAGEVASIAEEDHTDIEEKLDDLRNIVTKFLPEESDPVRTLTLMKQLYYLSDDLRKHTSIEDHILIPLMRRMEQDDK